MIESVSECEYWYEFKRESEWECEYEFDYEFECWIHVRGAIGHFGEEDS